MHAPSATGGVTRQIAEFVTGFPASRIPDAAFDRAEAGLVDTAACILAGAASEEAHPLTAFLKTRGGGDSPILGTALTADPATAALVNGTFGHALDYDDVLSIMPAHPSTVVLPALMALAPAGTSGRVLIDAYVIGIEVGARLGVAISNGHYRRGWHSTGTLAIFSAVAALGRLLKLDTQEVQTAFGIAASMASGLQCNFGTMTKPLHAGWASHNAVTAVLLAQSGFTAATDAFEAASGFFSTYGAEQSDVARAAVGLGEPFAILDPGLALKKYPSCYALHRPIDALLAIRAELPLSPETVDRVVVRVAPGALRPLIYKVATTGLEAKFCMEYTLAAGILDGRFGLAAYSDAGARRPGIAALMPHVEAIEDPRCFGDDVDPSRKSAGTLGFVEVTATLRDGRSATVRVDRPTGSPAKPLSWTDLSEKFADCARDAGLAPEASDAAFALWRDLRAVPDMRTAITLLTRTPA
jgi:2-methylcitrate dehydratase PrpD